MKDRTKLEIEAPGGWKAHINGHAPSILLVLIFIIIIMAIFVAHCHHNSVVLGIQLEEVKNIIIDQTRGK